MYDTPAEFIVFCDDMVIADESFSDMKDKLGKLGNRAVAELQNILKQILAFIEKTLMNFNKIRDIWVPVEVKEAVFYLNGRLFGLLDTVLGDIINKADTAIANRDLLAGIQGTDQYITLTVKSPDIFVNSQVIELDKKIKSTYVDYMKKAKTIMTRAQTQLNRVSHEMEMPLCVQNNYRVLESVAIADLIVVNKLFYFGKSSKYENGSIIQLEKPIDVRLGR